MFANEHSGKVTNQGQLDLQKQAASEGLDADVMRAKINQTHNKVETKQKDMTDNANNQIHLVEHHNKVMEQGMNNKIDEYEKDRIGQGNFIGKNLGIGGMNSVQKAQEHLKTPKAPNIKTLKNGRDK